MITGTQFEPARTVKSEGTKPVTGLTNVKTYSGSSFTTDAGEVENPPARPVTTTVAALESNEETLMPGDWLPAMSVMEPERVSLIVPFVSAVVLKVN